MYVGMSLADPEGDEGAKPPPTSLHICYSYIVLPCAWVFMKGFNPLKNVSRPLRKFWIRPCIMYVSMYVDLYLYMYVGYVYM